ncbi:MAG: HAD family phosphatase [Nitrospirae bacterium]|nr:MAG: HAD family phosphatase [Nitrospirota bacterium]
MIKAVIFDFGGVLAEEGFREGLKAIAAENRLDPDKFFSLAEDLIYETGYVLGMSDESFYLDALRGKTGIARSNREIREDILKRFVLRPAMLNYVKDIKTSGLITAMLSDQTNWLDELNEKTPFFHYFDYVFNSFYLKKGKRDSTIFRDVCSKLGLMSDEVLFVDDNIKNIHRASAEGLKTIHFKRIEDFEKEISGYIK